MDKDSEFIMCFYTELEKSVKFKEDCRKVNDLIFKQLKGDKNRIEQPY